MRLAGYDRYARWPVSRAAAGKGTYPVVHVGDAARCVRSTRTPGTPSEWDAVTITNNNDTAVSVALERRVDLDAPAGRMSRHTRAPASTATSTKRAPAADPYIRIAEAEATTIPDESAAPDADLEWWFVQGWYEGPSGGRRHFLTSIFRHRPASASPGDGHGYSLLLSVLVDGVQHAHSRIDPRSVALVLDPRHEPREVKLDRRFVAAYRDELARHGPPEPFVLDARPVEIGARPFRLAWGDFSIEQTRSGFALAFCEPAAGARCAFELTPSRPRILAEGIGEPCTSALAYATYPTMRLTGMCGDERVEGEAWFDHQWGAAESWALLRSARDRVLGWDWLGINLDDGTELLIIRLRDVTTRRAVDTCAIVRRPGEAPRVLRALSLHPRTFWESPRTHVRYPVSWRIRIPGLDAKLVFKPLAQDQELHVFGPGRAVWEGAGTIAGSIGGRAAAGRGRLELHGYGFLLDGKSYFQALSREVDACVASVFPPHVDEEALCRFAGVPEWRRDPACYNAGVAAPVWDLMARRGKQWRAIYNLLLLEAFGVPCKRYADIASAVPELVHTASLIIDDIEDSSTTRRGGPCIHLVHGVDVALNAANTVYFLPFLVIADHPGLTDAQRVEAYKLLFRGFTRAHLGQALDIQWSKHVADVVDAWQSEHFGERILQMYADKTSALIELAAECVCIVAAADPAARAACIAFARRLGVAFQIIDDVLNFSASARWGKRCGEDLAAGKPTYAIYRAWRALPAAERAELARILADGELRAGPAAVTKGMELVRSSGALELCRDEARAMVDAGWHDLSPHLRQTEAKIMLRCLCANLVDTVYES